MPFNIYKESVIGSHYDTLKYMYFIPHWKMFSLTLEREEGRGRGKGWERGGEE